MKVKPSQCSHETARRIDAALPVEVVAALYRHGWNALGVHDLVRRELARERHEKRTTEQHDQKEAA